MAITAIEHAAAIRATFNSRPPFRICRFQFINTDTTKPNARETSSELITSACTLDTPGDSSPIERWLHY